MTRLRQNLLLLLAGLIVIISSFVSSSTPSSEANVLTSSSFVSLSDLPPLPRKVLQWSPRDVERWMNITVGYPELSVIIRKYLIDGPTLLNLNNIEEVFTLKTKNRNQQQQERLHPAQIAKIKTHQRILRSQSPECGGSCSSSSSSSGNLLSFWSYLSYSSVSTTFHLTGLVVAPRVAFFSALIFDRPLLCCALATPTSTDVENDYANQLSSASEQSAGVSSEDSALVVSPCGYPSSVCDASPSILTSIIYFCFPFFSILWYGALRAMCPHPFIALAWFFACLCHQVAELFTFFRIYQLLRAKEVTVATVLKEEFVLAFLHWLFWGPCLVALFVGYLLPHWCSYILLLALTGVALWSSISFVMEFLRAFVGSASSSAAPDQQQQQENDNKNKGD